MRPLLLALLLLPSGMRAQYGGGAARGDGSSSFQPLPTPSNIYTGGNGRGDLGLLFMPVPIASNIFSGGAGRGDMSAIHQPVLLASNIFNGGTGRGDAAPRFDATRVLLTLKGVLEGPYNSSTGLMSDALRAGGLLPTTEPYTALGYVHAGGGGETAQSSLLAATGNNAVVDWVLVELRGASTPMIVFASRSALIQRDGDVVPADGQATVAFTAPPTDYFVVLRHRNHLGVMTQVPVSLNNLNTTIDLSVATTNTFGFSARKAISGTFPAQALWAGDATFNGELKYTGTGNDRDPILTTVGSTTPNNAITLYSIRDVNMDGLVKYTGSGNDRDPILVNVGGSTPNNTRTQQLP